MIAATLYVADENRCSVSQDIRLFFVCMPKVQLLLEETAIGYCLKPRESGRFALTRLLSSCDTKFCNIFMCFCKIATSDCYVHVLLSVRMQ